MRTVNEISKNRKILTTEEMEIFDSLLTELEIALEALERTYDDQTTKI